MLKKLDSRGWTTLLASALHVAALLCFLNYRSSYVAPMRLPGNRHGSVMVLTYSPGHMAPAAPVPVKRPVLQAKLTAPRLAAPKPIPVPAEQPAIEQSAVHPDATPGMDALGMATSISHSSATFLTRSPISPPCPMARQVT